VISPCAERNGEGCLPWTYATRYGAEGKLSFWPSSLDEISFAVCRARPRSGRACRGRVMVTSSAVSKSTVTQNGCLVRPGAGSGGQSWSPRVVVEDAVPFKSS